MKTAQVRALENAKQELERMAADSSGDVRMGIMQAVQRIQDLAALAQAAEDVESMTTPDPKGRYHLFDAGDSIEIRDAATRDPSGHPMGVVAAAFADRKLAWTALLSLNLDRITLGKIEHLMTALKANPTGMIVMLPNLSRAYVDMGRYDYNTIKEFS